MASRPAPIATPRAIHSPRLSEAAPIAAPTTIPSAMPDPVGTPLGTKSSEVEADDLWVIQKLTSGTDNGILALI